MRLPIRAKTLASFVAVPPLPAASGAIGLGAAATVDDQPARLVAEPFARVERVAEVRTRIEEVRRLVWMTYAAGPAPRPTLQGQYDAARTAAFGALASLAPRRRPSGPRPRPSTSTSTRTPPSSA